MKIADSRDFRRTTRVAYIKFGGKRYKRVVYEFIDPETGWWRDCVRIASMGSNPDSYCPLDRFHDVKVIEMASGMPGQWM